VKLVRTFTIKNPELRTAQSEFEKWADQIKREANDKGIIHHKFFREEDDGIVTITYVGLSGENREPQMP
jgi:hypothetical protein